MLWVNYIIYLLSNYAVSIHCSYCLDKKYKKSTFLYSTVFFLLLAIPATVKFFSVEDSVSYTISGYAGILLIILFFILGYSNPIWQKILFFVIWFGTQAVAEILSFSIGGELGINTEVDFSLFSTTMMISMDVLFILVLEIIYTLLWNLVFKSERIATEIIGLFCLLPLGHGFAIATISNLTAHDKQGINVSTGALLLAVLILDIATIVFIMFQAEKVRTQWRISELKTALESEQVKYESIKMLTDEKAGLRHDYKNQLAMIKHLICSNKPNEAKDTCKSICARN